jgi:hypothetical protein
MARSSKINLQNNFSRGLFTQATGLNFPENACTDTDNCVFNFGVTNRRLGFDFENGNDTYTIDLEGKAIVGYLWKNVAGEGDKVFVVEQIGEQLHFYDVSSDSSLSGSKHSDVIELIDFMPVGVTQTAQLECQFSSGNGLLFVTCERLDSFYVEWDLDTDTISATQIDLEVRDFEGDTADPYTVGERPTATVPTLNAAHFYNLKNQGWTDANLAAWDTARADMPSNTDVAWYFKDSSNAFDFTTVANRSVGAGSAPRGHFIYSPYDIDRTSNGGSTDFDAGQNRVKTSAFYAGRVFYSGLRGPRQSSRVFFSQIVEGKGQYGKCYQVNDPTDENAFEILPSDGGVIDVLEAGTIIKMVPVQQWLVLFCTNGIWAITGSQGVGFTANDYSVQKISSTHNLFHTSFVDVEGVPFWWNLEGIYTIQLDSQTNNLRVISVTDPTIRFFFLDIPSESKQFARGTYDQFTKQIQWIYKSRASNSFSDRYVYDRFLTFNTLNQAWYPWSVDDENVRIHGVTSVFGISGIFENENVVDSGVLVVDSGEQVIAFVSSTSESALSVIKYFVSYADGANTVVSFAENNSAEYLDWLSLDGEGQSYSSYLVTGYAVHGGGLRKFQQNYINIFSEDNAVDTSYKIRGQWNYSNTANSGKWSTAQTINVQTGNFDYRFNRIKLRGHGHACQFRIENNEEAPFYIIGWSVLESMNSNV